jgi:hypothetical protein
MAVFFFMSLFPLQGLKELLLLYKRGVLLLSIPVWVAWPMGGLLKKHSFPRLVKNIRMHGARNPEE